MRKLLIVAIILGVLGIWLITDQDNKDLITLQKDEKKLVSTNHKDTDMVWNELSDLMSLINYCSSLFKTNNNASSCVLTSESSEQIKLFASTLWKIWSGHSRRAKEDLELFQQEEAWSLWGKIGLMELALYTGNQKKLASLLDQFKDDFLSTKNNSLIEAYRNYELWHAFEDLNWKKLEKLLEKYTINQITSNPNLFLFQSSIYFVNGQRKKLKNFLNQTHPEVKVSANYINGLVYLAILEPKLERLDIIKKIFPTDRPWSVDIIFEMARLELMNDNPAVQEDALEKYFDIAKLSRNNPAYLLEIINSLASHHKFAEAEEIFKYLDVKYVDLEDFVIFKTVSAWNYVYIGDYENAAYEIELALKMAPKDLTANWLKVLLIKKLERPDLALRPLEILFTANPYNQSYRNQITYFRNNYDMPELESLYQRMIEHH